MFIHHGKRRTRKHNVQIGSLLSFVAGIVNVAGFLAVAKLTTNVTGHFAFFVDEVFRLNLWQGIIYFLYIFFFFLGSFISNFLVESISRVNSRFVYLIPVLIESAIITLVDFGNQLAASHENLIACSLLFAMGLQNSLVTKISNAIVRTTHLTGLFTDMGIELSQLFFYRDPEIRNALWASVRLRLTIIGFFFLGGIFSGVVYSKVGLNVLFFASATLLMGIAVDVYRLPVRRVLRSAWRR